VKYLSRREFNRRFGLGIKAIRQAKEMSRLDLAASLHGSLSRPRSEDEHLRTVAAFSAATTCMREEQGLTQDELAARSRVPLDFVRNLEAAKDTNPDGYFLYCLSYGLGVPFSKFRERAEEFLLLPDDESLGDQEQNNREHQ
jgi:DNA-binding transcriptional regulator YiaG